MMRFMLGLSLVLFLACCPCYVRADIGVSAGTDPFAITFDGYGNASVSVWNSTTMLYNPAQPEQGFKALDQSGAFPTTEVLTYALPEAVGPGGLNILSPVFPETTITGNLYFYNSGSVSNMEFLLPLGTGQPASTGTTNFGSSPFPPQNTNGTFSFVAGDGNPADTNFYNGTGIPIVPEPNTFIVMAFGLAALAGYSCWRRKQVIAGTEKGAGVFV